MLSSDLNIHPREFFFSLGLKYQENQVWTSVTEHSVRPFVWPVHCSSAPLVRWSWKRLMLCSTLLPAVIGNRDSVAWQLPAAFPWLFWLCGKSEVALPSLYLVYLLISLCPSHPLRIRRRQPLSVKHHFSSPFLTREIPYILTLVYNEIFKKCERTSGFLCKALGWNRHESSTPYQSLTGSILKWLWLM